MRFPKFPLVTRRSRDETVLGLTKALEMARHKAAAAEGAAATLTRANAKLREHVLGRDKANQLRENFTPGEPPRSDTSRFGAGPPAGDDSPLIDNGSIAAITAVALRKFNEVILLQADFSAVAMDEITLEFVLGGEKWAVAFTPAKLEN